MGILCSHDWTQLKFPALHLTKGRWPRIHGKSSAFGRLEKSFAHQAALQKRWFSDDSGHVEVTWAQGFGFFFGKPGKITMKSQKRITSHRKSDGIAWHSYINHHCTLFGCFRETLGALRPPIEWPVVNTPNERAFPAQAAKRQLGDCFFGLPKGRHVGVSDALMRPV